VTDVVPLKMLLVGDPKAGKTGALASLANAGYKLRVANFDGNTGPLLEYVKPEARGNLSIKVLSEKMRFTPQGVTFAGPPDSYVRLMKLLADWDGGGGVDTWDPNTVLVLDPLSHMTELQRERWQAMNPSADDVKSYTPVFDELINLLRALKYGAPCHVICITHLKSVGEPIDMRSRDERTRNPKVQAPEGSAQRDLAWKRFPSVAGKKLLTEVASYFDLLLHAKVSGGGRGAQRVLSLVPSVDVDVAAPVHLFGGKTELPIATGLATFFETVLRARGAQPVTANTTPTTTTQPTGVPT
jgi:hypothetical protein